MNLFISERNETLQSWLWSYRTFLIWKGEQVKKSSADISFGIWRNHYAWRWRFWMNSPIHESGVSEPGSKSKLFIFVLLTFYFYIPKQVELLESADIIWHSNKSSRRLATIVELPHFIDAEWHRSSKDHIKVILTSKKATKEIFRLDCNVLTSFAV